MSTLATRIGTEIKTVRTEVGPLATELEMQEGTSTEVRRVTPALVRAAVRVNNTKPSTAYLIAMGAI